MFGDKVMIGDIEVTQPCQSKIDIAYNYIWFLNEPNCDFDATGNKDVTGRVAVLHANAKYEELQQQKKNNTANAERVSLHDPILSDFLHARVFYVDKHTLQYLLTPKGKRQEKSNKAILKHSPVVRIRISSNIYIVAEFVPTKHNVSLVRQWEFIQSCYFDYLCKECPKSDVDGYTDYDSDVISFVIKQIYSKLVDNESVDIKHMNSSIFDEERERFKNQIWFNNPNVTLVVEDGKVQNKVKGMCMTAMATDIKAGLVYDLKLSHYLNSSEPCHAVNVFYMVKSKFRNLVEFINKNENMNIDPNVLVLKLYIDNNVFVLASSPSRIHRKIDNLRHNCKKVQMAFSAIPDSCNELFYTKTNEIYG